MEMNFCRRCGNKLSQSSGSANTCSKGHVIYLNPATGVGIFFIDDVDNIILSVRAHQPHKGMLDTFGGFLESGETLEQALEREIIEELNIRTKDYSRPVYLTSLTSDYPYEGESRTVVSALFFARLKPGVSLTPGDDVAAVYVSDISDVSLDDFGGADAKNGFDILRKRLDSGKLKIHDL